MCLIELSIGMEALVFSLFLVCSGKPASLGFVFKSLPQHYMCFIFPTFALAPFLKTKESIHFFFYFLVLERERERRAVPIMEVPLALHVPLSLRPTSYYSTLL